MGEFCAGLLARPMVISQAGSDAILPADVKPLLKVLAQVGLATLMFVIGYEIDGSLLRGRDRATLGLTAGPVFIPLASGIALTVPLAGR